MRRITTWLLSTISALVLLFSYHTSTSAAPATSIVASGTGTDTGSPSGATPQTGSGSTGSGSGSSSDSGSSSGEGSSSGGGSSSSSATTFSGDAVSTRFGNVQVEITVASGRITGSKVLQVPWNDHRDQEINSYAVPILNQEAVDQQSSTIDMVSGATYTSQGYIQSLQSAIDQAHL